MYLVYSLEEKWYLTPQHKGWLGLRISFYMSTSYCSCFDALRVDFSLTVKEAV